jgi:hypothetical protein
MANPFGPLYSFDFVVLVICAVAWFKAAKVEDVPPWLWAGLSVFTYAAMWLGLRFGIVGCVVGQAMLAIVIAVVRVWIERKSR